LDLRRSLPGTLLLLIGSGMIGIRAAPGVGGIGPPSLLAWMLLLVAGSWTVLAVGRLFRLRRGVLWVDRRILARDPPAVLGGPRQISRAGGGLLMIGALLALAGPHVGLVIGGMVVASVGAELVFRAGRRIPVLPLITLALLPAYWLLDAVAGPVGLSVEMLGQLPLSPAAARLLALPLGLVAWAWLGLWPLHGVVRPALLAPLGAALWLRVAWPAAADGLAHWQPIFVTLAVVGLWHAAADGRLASVFVALGFLAFATLGDASVAAGVVLLGAGLTLKLPRPMHGAPLVAFDALRRLGLASSAVGATIAFMAGLRAEVVLTVVAAAGLAYGYRAASPVNDL
jgi:hypothetical protein